MPSLKADNPDAVLGAVQAVDGCLQIGGQRLCRVQGAGRFLYIHAVQFQLLIPPFTSTFWRTKNEEERCTAICAASANANDDMANPTDEVKSRGVSA